MKEGLHLCWGREAGEEATKGKLMEMEHGKLKLYFWLPGLCGDVWEMGELDEEMSTNI